MAGAPEVRGRLLLAAAPWDHIDASFAALIPFDSPNENADLLTRLCATGCATSHRVMRDGERIGCLVSRVDVGTAGRELVVIAAYLRRDAAGSLVEPLHEACTALARAERCVSIRVHTCRAALARVACGLGFRISEIVLRRTLNAHE